MNCKYLKFGITYGYNMIFMLSTYVCTFLNTVTLHQQCCQPVFPIWLLPISWNVCSSILQHQIHSISLDIYCFYCLLFPAQVSNLCKCTYIHNLWLSEQKPAMFALKLKFILLPQLIATLNNYACALPPLANVDWSAFPGCFLPTM